MRLTAFLPPFFLLSSLLHSATFADPPTPAQLPKVEPGNAYLLLDTKDGTRVEKAPEWTPIKPLVPTPPDHHPKLLIDDVILTPVLVPNALATAGLARPAKGEQGIAICVHITSRTKDKKREYDRWAAAKLTDDKKNTYDQLSYRELSPLASIKAQVTRIDDTIVRDVLLFERPVAAAKEFYLELPGENVGVGASFRLKFSAEDLKLAQTLPKK